MFPLFFFSPNAKRSTSSWGLFSRVCWNLTSYLLNSFQLVNHVIKDSVGYICQGLLAAVIKYIKNILGVMGSL